MRLPHLRPRRWTATMAAGADWLEEVAETRRLGAATVRFAGFTPKRTYRNLRKFDLQVRTGPRLLELTDAVFVPRLRCLYTTAGVRIDETMWTYAEPDVPEWMTLDAKMGAKESSYMPERIDPPQPVERVADPVAYLGEAKQHYGHFVTDGMSRLWALPRLPARAVVHLDPQFAMAHPHVEAVWRALGFPPATLEAPRVPTLYEKVLCPVPAIQLSRRIYAEFDAPHRRVAAALTAGLPGPDRPVYLSRRGLGAGYRQLQGEEALEAGLAREGYAIVHPEAMPLAEQIAVFDGTQPIVGPTGSALHTVLFRTRREGLKLGVISPEDVGGRFPLIDMLKASRTTYANAMREITQAEDAITRPASQRSWAIDPERAMDLLADGGFFSRRRRD